MRVKIKFQPSRVGELLEILPGCNVLARVKFDGSNFSTLLPLSDLIFIKDKKCGPFQQLIGIK